MSAVPSPPAGSSGGTCSRRRVWHSSLLEKENGQVSRALRQYELALRQWHLGGEWLALSHLYMGVEALTEAVLRKARADRRFHDLGGTRPFARRQSSMVPTVREGRGNSAGGSASR